MPIQKEPGRAGAGGCRVTGTIVASGGKVSVFCEEGGLWQGTIWGTSPILLTHDGGPIKDGVLDLVLPPSSAVGRYVLRVGARIWRFNVPDAETADLATLLEEGNHGH